MKAIVMSDSHGDRQGLLTLLHFFWQQIDRVDAYFHCGDGVRDFASLEGHLLAHDPDCEMYGVRGNCDLFDNAPDEQTVSFGGARILLTHGHLYRVKSGLAMLDDAAAERECGIALFGHTHEPCLEMRRSLLLNPGSARDGRMLLLEVTEGKPKVRMLHMT